MKFLHLSDLHLGKRLNEYSLIEDQEYILKSILKIVREEKPDGVIIAGDVYDKSVPSGEAVRLFDDFLVALSLEKVKTFIISGNHDSPERLSFGARLMDKSGIYISMVYDGKVEKISLSDEFGKINIFMLPFVKPSHVRRFYGDQIESFTDAIRAVIDDLDLDQAERNILITHQFVTGASRTDSEEISVGGTDNVDASVFEKFDYVALGHIHRAQKCVSDKIRYSGTPLKYSLSEANDEKTITVVELNDKGSLIVRSLALHPLRNLLEIRGKYADIMQKSYYENTTWQTDYVYITLTDEQEIPDAMAKLRTVYHNVTAMRYVNTRTRNSSVLKTATDIESKTPFDLFSDFYAVQNGVAMSDDQKELVTQLVEKIWGAE